MPETQDQALIKLVTGRQSKLETEKINFNDRMQDVADYVCPHREDIRGTLQKGLKKGTKIYDGTAEGAAVIATDGIHGYHVSPAFPWFKYQMNRKEVNGIPEVRGWLDEIEFNMYMALNRSNFYSEMWSYIYDGFTIGTAPMQQEEDLAEQKIVYEAVHPGEVFIAENKYGEIDILHRKRKMTVRQMVQMFGKGNLTPDMVSTYETSPFTEFEVINAVFPREEYNERLKDAKNKKFASVWIATAGNFILRVSGFDRFPYEVWRYLKSGKEAYGLSPAILAMSDIKGLNIMAKTLLGSAQLALDPAYNIPSYLEGKVKLMPRGFNFFKEGTTDRITPVNTVSNFPVAIDREQAKQKAIKERFHVDFFLMLAQIEHGEMTAYEVSERMGEKAAVLGAELGPLNTRLDNILDRTYEIELNAGRMPKPPDILYEMADKDPHLRFDPVYMGPLAQAQRERFSKDGIRKFFTEIAPLIQAEVATGKPSEILDNFDLDEAGRYLADSNQIPASMIRSKESVLNLRQGRMEALQKQNQATDAMQTLSGLKTASEADKNMGGALSQGIQQMMGGTGAAA